MPEVLDQATRRKLEDSDMRTCDYGKERDPLESTRKLPDAVYDPSNAATGSPAARSLETGLSIAGKSVRVANTEDGRGLVHWLQEKLSKGARLAVRVAEGVLWVGEFALIASETVGMYADPTGISQTVFTIHTATRVVLAVNRKIDTIMQGTGERFGSEHEVKPGSMFVAFEEEETERPSPDSLEAWTSRWKRSNEAEIKKLIVQMDEDTSAARLEAEGKLLKKYDDLKKFVYPLPSSCTDLVKPDPESVDPKKRRYSPHVHIVLRRVHAQLTEREPEHTRIPPGSYSARQLVDDVNAIEGFRFLELDEASAKLLRKPIVVPAFAIDEDRGQNILFLILQGSLRGSGCTIEKRGQRIAIVPGNDEDFLTDGSVLVSKNRKKRIIGITVDPAVGTGWSLTDKNELPTLAGTFPNLIRRMYAQEWTFDLGMPDIAHRHTFDSIFTGKPPSKVSAAPKEEGVKLTIRIGTHHRTLSGRPSEELRGPDTMQAVDSKLRQVHSPILRLLRLESTEGRTELETTVDIYANTDAPEFLGERIYSLIEAVRVHGSGVRIELLDESGKPIATELLDIETKPGTNVMTFRHAVMDGAPKPASVRISVPQKSMKLDCTVPASFLNDEKTELGAVLSRKKE